MDTSVNMYANGPLPAKDPEAMLMEDFPSGDYADRYDSALSWWIMCVRLQLPSTVSTGTTDLVPRINLLRDGVFDLNNFSVGGARRFCNKVAAVYMHSRGWGEPTEIFAAAFSIWATKHATSGTPIPRLAQYSICQGIWIDSDTAPLPSTVIEHHKTLTQVTESHEGAFPGVKLTGPLLVLPSWKHVLLMIDGDAWKHHKMQNPGREGTESVPVVAVARLDTILKVADPAQGWSDCSPTTNNGAVEERWASKAMSLTTAIYLIMKAESLWEYPRSWEYPRADLDGGTLSDTAVPWRQDSHGAT